MSLVGPIIKLFHLPFRIFVGYFLGGRCSGGVASDQWKALMEKESVHFMITLAAHNVDFPLKADLLRY
jgi:hypothetical protein